MLGYRMLTRLGWRVRRARGPGEFAKLWECEWRVAIWHDPREPHHRSRLAAWVQGRHFREGSRKKTMRIGNWGTGLIVAGPTRLGTSESGLGSTAVGWRCRDGPASAEREKRLPSFNLEQVR